MGWVDDADSTCVAASTVPAGQSWPGVNAHRYAAMPSEAVDFDPSRVTVLPRSSTFRVHLGPGRTYPRR